MFRYFKTLSLCLNMHRVIDGWMNKKLLWIKIGGVYGSVIVTDFLWHWAKSLFWFLALWMKSWYDGIVLHMATKSQAKCELKGNFKKLISVAAWMQESANNHETSFKIEAFFCLRLWCICPSWEYIAWTQSFCWNFALNSLNWLLT